MHADHDISLLLQHLIDASPVTIDYAWVKSHQDELPTGELIHGPFLRPVQLNQYVDTLAGHGRDEANDILKPKPVFSTTVLQLYSNAGVAIDDWGHYLVNVINGATMRDYYHTRKGWTHTELGMVDWEAISLMLNATPHTKHMKILQLQHGWQNTGNQKLQFLEATEETITESMKTDNDVYCPFDCGEHEGRLHYMQCTQDTMKKKRLQLRRALLDRMRRRNTDPLLLSILSYVLTCLDTASPIDFQPDWTTTPNASVISKLFDHQSALGWNTILQGFFVHEWSRIQRHYMRHHPQPQRLSTSTYRRPTIESWKKTFATELISYSIDCWQHRNDKLHGALDILHDNQHRKLLHKRVRQLYKESRILTRPDDKRYFHMPCRLRVKQRHVTLETWADTVGLIITRHRERTARETLDTWIMQRPGTTHSP